MLQTAKELPLSLKALRGVLIAERAQQLDRHLSTEATVGALREPHLPHPTNAERPNKTISCNHLPREVSDIVETTHRSAARRCQFSQRLTVQVVCRLGLLICRQQCQNTRINVGRLGTNFREFSLALGVLHGNDALERGQYLTPSRGTFARRAWLARFAHNCDRELPSTSNKYARAFCQSRFTVIDETPRTSAISSKVRPPK